MEPDHKQGPGHKLPIGMLILGALLVLFRLFETGVEPR